MSDSSTILRRLNWVKWLAIIDAVLLVPLVIAAITDTHGLVSVLGPIHGIGFIGLCALIGIGALEGLWGWWFLLVTIVTLGPPGSLWGEWRIKRQLTAGPAAAA
ncbi:MAG: hypothetical protein JWP17_2481 [Solirubrobacterales bacterium]|jgi:hypothetical protein|nr:hypothetical protein [Solirubrobacterales bacterium]